MRLFILVPLIFGWACTQPSGNKTPEPGSTSRKEDLLNAANDQITCWGIGQIDLGDTYSAVEEKVGKDNISIDSLFLEGNFERLITTLWKGSDKEILVYWTEAKPPFQSISSLEISNQKSPYHFINGIKIGSKLSKVVELNNHPVSLYGFGWDYGGTFTSFGNGKLAGDMPCFGGVFQLNTTDGGKDVMAIMGDHEITSSHPSFKKYDPILTTIRISKK